MKYLLVFKADKQIFEFPSKEARDSITKDLDTLRIEYATSEAEDDPHDEDD